MTSKVEFIYLSQEDVCATGIDMPQTIKIVEKVLGIKHKPVLPDFLGDEGIISSRNKMINEAVEEYNKRIKSLNQMINLKENLESDSSTKGESS